MSIGWLAPLSRLYDRSFIEAVRLNRLCSVLNYWGITHCQCDCLGSNRRRAPCHDHEIEVVHGSRRLGLARKRETQDVEHLTMVGMVGWHECHGQFLHGNSSIRVIDRTSLCKPSNFIPNSSNNSPLFVGLFRAFFGQWYTDNVHSTPLSRKSERTVYEYNGYNEYNRNNLSIVTFNFQGGAVKALKKSWRLYSFGYKLAPSVQSFQLRNLSSKFFTVWFR